MIKTKELSRCSAILDNSFLCPSPLLYIVCFENKRVVIEELNIKIWIDGEKIRIEVVISMCNGVIAAARLLPHLSLAHRLSL